MSKLTEWALCASHLFGEMSLLLVLLGSFGTDVGGLELSGLALPWPHLGTHSLHTFSTHSHLAPVCLLLGQKVLHECIDNLFYHKEPRGTGLCHFVRWYSLSTWSTHVSL